MNGAGVARVGKGVDWYLTWCTVGGLHQNASKLQCIYQGQLRSVVIVLRFPRAAKGSAPFRSGQRCTGLGQARTDSANRLLSPIPAPSSAPKPASGPRSAQHSNLTAAEWTSAPWVCPSARGTEPVGHSLARCALLCATARQRRSPAAATRTARAALSSGGAPGGPYELRRGPHA